MVSEHVLHIHDLDFVPFLDHQQILKRVAELATQINHDYENKNPVFIPILNGSFMFASDLLKEICIPCEISFVKLGSYLGLKSSGEIKEIIGLQCDIKNRHVIIVEDIVDTGATMSKVIETFKVKSPASLTIASMFAKPKALEEKLPISYLGFEIENKFIVGYGLDYNQLGRNYRDVYQKLNT
jgi:hypoxanthine phosphoribosyltransferase